MAKAKDAKSAKPSAKASAKTDKVEKALVIVESPAKAKTINAYLGRDYQVIASYGHVRDLPAKDGSVDPDNGFAMTWQAYGDCVGWLREERLYLDPEAHANSIEPSSDQALRPIFDSAGFRIEAPALWEREAVNGHILSPSPSWISAEVSISAPRGPEPGTTSRYGAREAWAGSMAMPFWLPGSSTVSPCSMSPWSRSRGS